MKKTKRILSILLVTVMLMTTVPVSAVASKTNTVILYTNDVHCTVDNYGVFAAYRAELETKNNKVITVDAGDAFQGEYIGSYSEGEYIVNIMNEIGYDIAVPGEYEFDYGLERLLYLTENVADYEYTSSNFCSLQSLETVFKPYVIKDGGNGEKIAFVGISTPETFEKTSHEYFKGEYGNFIYGFPQYPDGMTNESLYQYVQKSVDAAINEGADIVIAVGHLGIEGAKEGWKSTDVIASTNGIDYFIDAHSHETIESAVYKNKDNKDVVLTSAGEKLAKFGEITITPDGEVSFKLINPADVDVDPMTEQAKYAHRSVNNLIENYKEQVAEIYDPIGTSEIDLIACDEDGNWLARKGETNLGNYMADAYIAFTSADIGLVNGGNICSNIAAGNVSRNDFMNINQFENEMCAVLLTGQQIVDALEFGARNYPDPSSGFLQVSYTLSYEIDAYKESPVIVDESGNFVSIDKTKERRVKNVMFLDRPIELGNQYRVTGTEYLLMEGGDGYTMFKGAISSGLDAKESYYLTEYLTKNLGGKITAEKYGNLNGNERIIINENAPAVECDHMCHSDGFFARMIWGIVRFFSSLFGSNPICECGVEHY